MGLTPLNLEALRSEYEKGAFTKAAYSQEIWKVHQGLFAYPRFLKDTNVRTIEISGDGVIVQLRDPSLKLWCTPHDTRHVAIASINFRSYESEEIDTVLRMAEACEVIFDIGANVGVYSVALGQRLPEATIFAFEPVPATYKELQRNLVLNEISNVTTLNLGLSDRAGSISFYFDPTVSGAASAAPLGSEFGATETLTCPVETLDEFVDRTGVLPDFIKCDVEGGELAVFRGATKMFERSRPIVFTEMLRKWAARFGYHPNEIIAFFRNIGYECFTLTEGQLQPFGAMSDETVETNFFFLNRQRHMDKVRSLGLMR